MKYFICLTLLLASVTVFCQSTEKIETDRPDQTESPFTVPHNWVQIEAGLVRESFSNKTSSWTTPSVLWKYGFSKKTELRIITEYNTVRFGNRFTDTTGFQPLQIGFKLNLFEEKGILPKTSFIAHTGFNKLGSRFFRNLSFLAPNFRFTMQHSLSNNIGLGYNLGAEWEDTNNPPVWIYTFAPGFNLNEKWYAYIEAFGFIQKGEAAQHNIDGGLAYYINNDCKIDLSGGPGLSRESSKWYINVGGSFRFSLLKKKAGK